MSRHVQSLLAHLHRLAAPAAPDAVLLQRWIHQHDQDAFAALMARHGPMVLGVCRRLLGDRQEAEDVFQAVFLVLARRAARLRQPEALAGFLYTVARRLARKARAVAQRRPAVQGQVDVLERIDPQPGPLDVLSGRELLALIDDEIARLPEVYRLPLLLCLLQGRTIEEAARQLGWSIGSVRGRLTRGRERLRQRLSRRGLDLAVGVAALSAPVAVPERLLAEALAQLAAPSAAIRALAAGWTSLLKMKMVGLGLVVLSAAALGTGLSFLSMPVAEKPAASVPTAPPAQAKNEPRRDLYGDPLPPGAIARLGTQRWRACGDVQSLAFTPDGQTVIALSPAAHPLAETPSANGLCLFDVVSGKRIKSVRPPGTSFGRIALSADGKRLAAVCALWPDEDRGKTVVQIRELPSGGKLQEFDVFGRGEPDLHWLGWSSDNHPLVANLGKGEMLLRNLATGQERRFPAKDLPELARHWVCICVVGKNVLAASDKNAVIHVWDPAGGEKRCVLKSGSSIHRLALSPNERWLASLDREPAGTFCVHLWNTATGEVVHRIATEQKWMDGVVFSPDGKVLASIGWHEVCFWDVATGRAIGRTKGEVPSFGPGIAFSPDGKTLAASERYSAAIHLWDVPGGTMKPQAEGHTHDPHPPAFSPDGKRVATSSPMDGTIFIWDPATGEPCSRIHQGDEAGICAFSTGGRTLYSLHGNQLIFFDAASGRQLHVLKVEDPLRRKTPFGRSLHLSADGARLIVVSSLHDSDGGSDNEMLVSGWDTATRKQLFQYRHPGPEFGYAFSMAGRMLAAHPTRRRVDVQASGPMQLEDAETGGLLCTFPALQGQTWPLTFSSDGRLLASNNVNQERKDKKGDPAAATGYALRLWETATASEVLALPLEPLSETAFSPDGRLLALPAPGGDLLLWDLRRGKELRRFRGFDARITSLAFSPDGRKLVSGLSDSTCLVWDVSTPPADSSEKLGAESVVQAWGDLAADAPRAFRARGTLASAPEEAIPLLRKHLHPAKAADPQRLHRLLVELDSEQFAVREKAQKELAKLGDLAEPALRQTLANKPSLEMRKRVQALLERLRGPVTQPELLQGLRAVAVLKDIGTPEALRLLQELAKGAAESRLTGEARASLERIERRSTSK